MNVHPLPTNNVVVTALKTKPTESNLFFKMAICRPFPTDDYNEKPQQVLTVLELRLAVRTLT